MEMCWGDVGLLLSMPRQGLGNSAIASVANDEQLVETQTGNHHVHLLDLVSEHAARPHRTRPCHLKPRHRGRR